MSVDEYTLTKRIGKGVFGEVYLGFKKGSQAKYAIKKKELSRYLKNIKAKRYLDNQILIMKDINHPNIIKLLDVKINEKFVFIITEYCNGGNLEVFLDNYLEANNKALPEEIVQNIMRQVIEAFRYLNNKKIMNRRINLSHILINYENEYDRENKNILKGKIKINGFGLARYLKKGELATSLFEVSFISPIFINKVSKNTYDIGAGYDEREVIFALGIICYELLVGNNPFESDGMNELENKINNGDYYIPITLSKEAISFIDNMLQYYPKDRLSIDELYNHDFLTKNVKDFNKLNLDIIKKYENNQKIKINTRDNSLIKKILENQNCELVKSKSSNLDELFWNAIWEFQKYSISIEPKLLPIKLDITDKDYEL